MIDKNNNAFTLMEVLIATFILVVVLVGIFGAYRLIAKVVQLNERKITASAIATQQMEKIRSLPYLKVGTKQAELPYAQGILSESTTTERNDVEYEIQTKVKLIADSADGLNEQQCNWDYKRVQVSVGWEDDQIKLVSDFTPADIAEENAVCQDQPGGIISVGVMLDDQGELVSYPVIKIFDAATDELVDSYQPASGKYDFALATSTYKIVVSKSGYSTSSTYGTDEIFDPGQKRNPTLSEGEVETFYFSISPISSLKAKTFSTWSANNWVDNFDDESKINNLSGLVAEQSQVKLSTSSTSGYLTSVGIDPNQLSEWDKLSWTDSEPIGTDFKYQLYYATSSNWHLVSDTDLAGNSVGFDSSPVDISDLNVSGYSKLKIRGNASSTSTTSPVLKDWQLSWKTSESELIGDTSFYLRGEKVIGEDADGNSIYKYSATTTSDSDGKAVISALPPDSYHFKSAESDLNLVTTTPSQPVNVSAGGTTTADLFFESQNSLMVTVQNKESLEPVFGASTTLSSTDYSQSKRTDQDGQSYFIPLTEDSYTLEVSAPAHKPTTTSIYISGNKTGTVKLEQIE